MQARRKSVRCRLALGWLRRRKARLQPAFPTADCENAQRNVQYCGAMDGPPEPHLPRGPCDLHNVAWSQTGPGPAGSQTGRQGSQPSIGFVWSRLYPARFELRASLGIRRTSYECLRIPRRSRRHSYEFLGIPETSLEPKKVGLPRTS